MQFKTKFLNVVTIAEVVIMLTKYLILF